MKYTKEFLEIDNRSYLAEGHTITQKDLELINKLSEHIESTRSTKEPKVGDIIRFTNQEGDYYPHAYIETNKNGDFYVCQQPSVPFVSINNDEISCLASGGPWRSLQTPKLKYIGKEMKRFCTWGYWGPCKNGSIVFDAAVSVWEYIEPNCLYNGLTTKDYDKYYFRYRKDSSPYTILGKFIAFRDQDEFNLWLKTYRGTQFGELSDGNVVVVFTYKEYKQLISKEAWDALDLPQDTRYMNGGTVPVKVAYDDKNHCMYTYRYTNNGDNKKTLYILAMYEGAFQNE